MKTYPHEQLLNREKLSKSDLPQELKEQIELFEEKFDDIDPDSLPVTHPIIEQSKAIMADIKDWLDDQDTGDELSQDEKDEQVLLDAMSNLSVNGKTRTSVGALKTLGFSKELKPRQWVTCGKLRAMRESLATTYVVIESV